MNYTINFFKRNLLRILFLAIVIATIFVFANSTSAETALEKREKQLREELERLEEQQTAVQNSLDTQKGKSATIQRDLNILGDQIYSAELSIQKKNIEIQELEQTIDLKKQTITELNAKMERSRDALSELIKQANEIDKTSLPEIILSNRSLTDFFADLDSYNSIQRQLEDLFDQIREIKSETEEETQELSQKQNDELDVKKEIEAEKRTIAVKKNEKDGLLSLSKKSEATYESILEQKRAEAARIRTALFQLRDTDGIPFGEALEYAQKASRATGVRAAFILAILTQESNLGKNVGTCNLAGQPAEKLWTSIMPGPTDGSWRDDQTIFERITKDLGLDPNNVPLSCPWQGGWGGAMGPSQFIPVTWQSYESRLASTLGVKTPDPWNPEHAIMATSLYVKDLGAGAGGWTAERTAALKYYAGSNWSLPQNSFYGNSVMVHADEIQQQVDFLSDVD
jgi:membrane-bound lytic murein transglycosylase B